MSERCAIHPDRLAEITCTRCGSYACYECVGPTEGGICAKCRLRLGGGTGARLRQVKALGWAMIVNGVLASLFGFLYVMLAVVMPMLPNTDPTQDSPPPEFMIGIFGCFGLVHVVPGILQIIAGARLLSHRNRAFALLALASGAMTFFGCYCAISSIAIGVWGLTLLSDPEVQAHFERTER